MNEGAVFIKPATFDSLGGHISRFVELFDNILV